MILLVELTYLDLPESITKWTYFFQTWSEHLKTLFINKSQKSIYKLKNINITFSNQNEISLKLIIKIRQVLVCLEI